MEQNLHARKREASSNFRNPHLVPEHEGERSEGRGEDWRERIAARRPSLRRRMNNELNFPPNFERLVLGCIDADFCK